MKNEDSTSTYLSLRFTTTSTFNSPPTTLGTSSEKNIINPSRNNSNSNRNAGNSNYTAQARCMTAAAVPASSERFREIDSNLPFNIHNYLNSVDQKMMMLPSPQATTVQKLRSQLIISSNSSIPTSLFSRQRKQRVQQEKSQSQHQQQPQQLQQQQQQQSQPPQKSENNNYLASLSTRVETTAQLGSTGTFRESQNQTGKESDPQIRIKVKSSKSSSSYIGASASYSSFSNSSTSTMNSSDNSKTQINSHQSNPFTDVDIFKYSLSRKASLRLLDSSNFRTSKQANNLPQSSNSISSTPSNRAINSKTIPITTTTTSTSTTTTSNLPVSSPMILATFDQSNPLQQQTQQKSNIIIHSQHHNQNQQQQQQQQQIQTSQSISQILNNAAPIQSAFFSQTPFNLINSNGDSCISSLQQQQQQQQQQLQKTLKQYRAVDSPHRIVSTPSSNSKQKSSMIESIAMKTCFKRSDAAMSQLLLQLKIRQKQEEMAVEQPIGSQTVKVNSKGDHSKFNMPISLQQLVPKRFSKDLLINTDADQSTKITTTPRMFSQSMRKRNTSPSLLRGSLKTQSDSRRSFSFRQSHQISSSSKDISPFSSALSQDHKKLEYLMNQLPTTGSDIELNSFDLQFTALNPTLQSPSAPSFRVLKPEIKINETFDSQDEDLFNYTEKLKSHRIQTN